MEITIANYKKKGFTIEEVLCYLCISRKFDLNKAKVSLLDKGILYINDNNTFIDSTTAKETIEECISTSKVKHKEESFLNNLTELATELKALFPKGKKPNSVQYWAEAVSLIEKRLILFGNKYGTHYTSEQIIEATKAYVNSFNGNYTYMRVLKYFIFKNEVKTGEVEPCSELLNLLEEGVGGDVVGVLPQSYTDWSTEVL